MSNLEIRNLNISNYNEILNLWNKARLAIKPYGRDSQQAITKQMKLNPEGFIGVFTEGKLVGIIIVTDDTRKGYLNRIAVDPGFKGKGIGKLLTKTAENLLTSRGIKVISLLIESDNLSSRALALKAGFVEHKNITYFSKRNSSED